MLHFCRLKKKETMKRGDMYMVLVFILLFAPFFLSHDLYMAYKSFNGAHGMLMSFVKFAILATLGEVIGFRIKHKAYPTTSFGWVPRAVIWGFLGLTIKMAFVIFATGTPAFLAYLGVPHAQQLMAESFSMPKLLVAFAISAAMNMIYAPVMMTLHKITDMHIAARQGGMSALWTPIQFRQHFVDLDWATQWGFVFKKTIPFFWIPAHTITFLLPADMQVLFAALLGVALGVILAVAGKK